MAPPTILKEDTDVDPRLKEIVDNFDSMKIGLDDTFHFGCKQCGKCCINREDILLNAKDVYHLCKALNLTPEQVMERYCEVYIGHDSRIPIVRLKPRGSIKRCPLLKDRRCSVHSLKPTVCAMYPIGRCLGLAPKGTRNKDLQSLEIAYFYNRADCGEKSETHTVREWLAMFGIPIDDECFKLWQRTILSVSRFVHKAEKKLSEDTMSQIWGLIHAVLYLCYDPNEAFLPQLQTNSQKLLALLDEIPLK